MITALDTNVLLDVLVLSAPAQAASRAQLDAAIAAGSLIVSEAVLAELAAVFPSRAALDEFLTATGIRLVPSNPEALWRTGQAWRAYSGLGGASMATAGDAGRGAGRAEGSLEWWTFQIGLVGWLAGPYQQQRPGRRAQ
jgi:predicted nucleic acid-binding protein